MYAAEIFIIYEILRKENVYCVIHYTKNDHEI